MPDPADVTSGRSHAGAGAQGKDERDWDEALGSISVNLTKNGVTAFCADSSRLFRQFSLIYRREAASRSHGQLRSASICRYRSRRYKIVHPPHFIIDPTFCRSVSGFKSGRFDKATMSLVFCITTSGCNLM